MGKLYKDGHAVITYDEALKDIFWVELSSYLQRKYTSEVKFGLKDSTLSTLIAISFRRTTIFLAYEFLHERIMSPFCNL